MQSAHPEHESPVQFNSSLKNSYDIMDIYLAKHILDIPIRLKRNLVSEVKISGADFIMGYNKMEIESAFNRKEISQKDYTELNNLFETLIFIGTAFGDESKSEADFNKRCKVISEFVPMTVSNIKKYKCGSSSDITFHLFECIYDLIYKKVIWKKEKPDILNYGIGYSDKYKILSKKGMAEKLNFSRARVNFMCEKVEREISDIINIFKMLEPYYSYKADYLQDEDILFINQDVINRIFEKEKQGRMTNRFAANILAVIYNYRVKDMSKDGKEEYWLIRKDYLYPDKLVRLINRIRNDIKAAREEENPKMIGQIMNCIGREYMS
jgi:hypothetical protein